MKDSFTFKFKNGITKYKTTYGAIRYGYKIVIDGSVIKKMGFKTREDAVYALNNAKRNRTTLTWHYACQKFMVYIAQQIKNTTLYKYKLMIKNHLNFPENITLEEIDFKFLFDWFSSMNASRRTKVDSLFILGRIMDFCNLYFETNNYDYKKIIIPKDFSIRRVKEEKILSLNEFRIFMSVIDSDFWKEFFLLEFITGMRFGEIRGLTYGDFDYQRNLLYVNHQATNAIGSGKTEIISPKSLASNRCYVLPSFLVQRFKNKKKNNSDFLFPCRRKTKKQIPIGSSTIYRQFYMYQKKSGLDHFVFHSFRKSEATFLNEIGVTDDDIKNWLGHDSFEVTKRYYIKNTVDKKKVVCDALDKKLKSLIEESED